MLHGGENFRTLLFVPQQNQACAHQIAGTDGVPVVGAVNPPMSIAEVSGANVLLVRRNYAPKALCEEAFADFGREFVLEPPVDLRQIGGQFRGGQIAVEARLVKAGQIAIMGGQSPALFHEKPDEFGLDGRDEPPLPFDKFCKDEVAETLGTAVSEPLVVRAIARAGELQIDLLVHEDRLLGKRNFGFSDDALCRFGAGQFLPAFPFGSRRAKTCWLFGKHLRDFGDALCREEGGGLGKGGMAY